MNATALRALGILGGEQLVRLMTRIREGDDALEDDLFQMERAASSFPVPEPMTNLCAPKTKMLESASSCRPAVTSASVAPDASRSTLASSFCCFVFNLFS